MRQPARYKRALPRLSFRRKKNIAADEIEENAKCNEGNHREQIGERAFEEWIVRGRPFLKGVEAILHRDDQEGEEHTRERAAGDVTGGEKQTPLLLSPSATS